MPPEEFGATEKPRIWSLYALLGLVLAAALLVGMAFMVDFDEVEGAVETPIYSHDGLPAGVTIEGPAIVEQLDSTTVIPPGVRAEVDEWLNIRIHVAEA